jgi:feruloyl esterase
MNHWTATALTGLALYHGAAYAQTGQAACERMRSFHHGASRVLAAEYLSGAFTPPPIGPFTPRPIVLPPHCSVRIVTPTSADSTVISEIWLPDPAQWNAKMLGTGNGGYSSALSYIQMAAELQQGFAVGGSDTGHQGDGLSFGIGNTEKIRNWAYRSTHVLAVDEKAVVASYYHKPPDHAYFAGCSTGGQQALSEAQRYPADFDGIVAGDPGNDRILLNADFVESWLAAHPANGAAFPASKLALLSKAVVAACDKQDGLADGIISDPRACSFDPGTLACSATADPSTCLTESEVGIVRQLYVGPVRDGEGKPMYPGWPRGSEAGWGSYIVSPSQPVRLEFWTSWVFDSSPFDLRAFSAPAAVAAARAKLPFVDAIDLDLRRFQQRGGKLLMYHGWADPVVPPEDTIGYYQKVSKILGSEAQSSVRLFMVPGMGHCGGGPGASTFDAVAALDQWVTKATSPDSILATHNNGQQPSFERPLCPFPQVAKWDGQGDPAKASSFHCAEDHSK